MPIVYQPAVRIVLGYAATALRPPATYASRATVALQKAVASLGKDWKRVAPVFVVAPAARSGRVVVGLAMSRAPMAFDSPRMLYPNTAIAKEHYVTEASFGRAPDVDKHGNTRADQGILDALAAGASDPALADLELALDDRNAGPAHFLVSDDGRSGALVFGQALWRPGESYRSDTVRTWSRDYGGGEGVRVVGAAYCEVGLDAPLAAIDASYAATSAHGDATRRAVRSLLDTQAAWGFYLVSGDPPAGAAAEVEAPRVRPNPKRSPRAPQLGASFTVRSFAKPLAALASLGEDATALVPLAASVPGVARTYSHDDVDGAPDRPPYAVLYELDAAPESATLADPAKLVRSAFVSSATGAWNASAVGRWANGPDWIVADLELVPEQADDAVDERVRAILALFAIEEGWAAAVWPSMGHEQLATILGFDPWKSASWRDCEVWVGE